MELEEAPTLSPLTPPPLMLWPLPLAHAHLYTATLLAPYAPTIRSVDIGRRVKSAISMGQRASPYLPKNSPYHQPPGCSSCPEAKPKHLSHTHKLDPTAGTRSCEPPAVRFSTFPASAQRPVLAGWLQPAVTWVSIVIDVYSTAKGEAKAGASWEGAVQDLGGAWTQPFALTQEYQHLALTPGTPVGGRHSNVWKGRERVRQFVVESLWSCFSSPVLQVPGDQEKDAKSVSRREVRNQSGINRLLQKFQQVFTVCLGKYRGSRDKIPFIQPQGGTHL